MSESTPMINDVMDASLPHYCELLLKLMLLQSLVMIMRVLMGLSPQ